MESPGDELALAEEREVARLYAWRLQQLLEAGYDDDAAALLAAQLGVDLHRARLLLEQGCSPKTALRILL